MSYGSRSTPESDESLHRDLLGVREMALESPEDLKANGASIYAILEAGLASAAHYERTTETILNLIAVVVTDDSWKEWFEPVAERVANQPLAPDNSYSLEFRDLVAEFRPLVGVFGRLANERAIVVADLLAAYTRLFRMLTVRHGIALQPRLLDQALAVSQRLGDHIETDKLYQTLALYFAHYGDADTAKQYARLAFADATHIDYVPGVVDAAATLAIIHRRAAELRHADYYIEQAMQQAEMQKPDKLAATLFYEYGVQCYRQDQFELALDYYMRALSVFEQFEALPQIAMTKHAMVLTYVYMHAFDRVETLLAEVRQSWQRLDNQFDYVNTFFVEAEFEVERGNRSRAMRLLRDTEALAYRTLEDTPARAHLIERINDYIAEHSRIGV